MEFDLVLYNEMKKHLSEVLFFTQECICSDVDDIQEDIFDLLKVIEVNSEKRDYFLEKGIEKLIAHEEFAEQQFRQVNLSKSFRKCYNGLKSYNDFMDRKAENVRYATACKSLLMDFQRDINIGYKNLNAIEQFLEEPQSQKIDTINSYLKNIETYLKYIEQIFSTWIIDDVQLNSPHAIRKYSDFLNKASGELRNDLTVGGDIKQNLCNIDLLFQKIIGLNMELKVKEIKVDFYDSGIRLNDNIKVNELGALELPITEENGNGCLKYYSLWTSVNEIFQSIFKNQNEWAYTKLINDEMPSLTIGLVLGAQYMFMEIHIESFIAYYKTVVEQLLKLIENKKIDFKRVMDLFEAYPIQYDIELYKENFVYAP